MTHGARERTAGEHDGAAERRPQSAAAGKALPLVFDHTSVSACVTEQSHGGRTNPWMRAVTASTEGVERR